MNKVFGSVLCKLTRNLSDIAGNARFCAISQEQNPRYQVQFVRFSAVMRGFRLTSRRAIWCNLVRLREGENPIYRSFTGNSPDIVGDARFCAIPQEQNPRYQAQFTRFSAVSRAIRPISWATRRFVQFNKKSSLILYKLTGNCPPVLQFFRGGERQI